MPRAFDITAVTDSIRLNAAGQGELSFTVSNALRAPVHARLSVLPGTGAKAEWFSIDGGAERDFATDGTQQVTVKLRVPPGTPPGRHTFQLLVVDVTNPDERYAQGPTSGFEVAAAPPPKKPFPWMWVVLAAGVVLILGTVIGIIASESREEDPALGEACPEGRCEKGLECTAQDGGVCLAVEGHPCDGGAQCLTGFCDKAGTCGSALGQACAADGTCPGTLKCTEALGSRLCLFPPEAECESDRDCSSFFCRDGRCNRDDGRCENNDECRQPSTCGPTQLCQLPDGQPCTQGEVCLSGNCAAGVCQPPPAFDPCARINCPAGTSCRLGRCVFVRDHRINQDLLMGSPAIRQELQQLQIQQQLQQ